MHARRDRKVSVNPTDMDPRAVSRWVSTLGSAAQQFSQIFTQKEIDGFHLISLSDADLKNLGVRSRHVRKKILLGAARIKQNAMNSSPEGGVEFDFVETIKQWANFAYYFSDYVDVCELIVEFSGVDFFSFPGSDFRKQRRGAGSNYYAFKQVVGKGAFGVVHKIVEKQSKEVRAAKTIKLGTGSKARRVRKGIKKEIDIMKVCKHENVINFIEYFETQDYIEMVMEYLGGKNLLERLLDQDGFSEGQALGFFRQMTAAVKYLHSIDLVHRDVKLDNFLLENWSNEARIVLADFGLSQRLRKYDALSHPCGTLGYTAPEVVKAEPYSLNCDVWSLGVCMFIMLVGYPPFEVDTEGELHALIVAGEYSLEGNEWDRISDEAKSLIRELLTYDWRSRCSAKEILDHAWLKSTGVIGKKRSERARFTRTATSAAFNSKTSETFQNIISDDAKLKRFPSNNDEVKE